MDADELARLRDELMAGDGIYWTKALALIDDLEKAQALAVVGQTFDKDRNLVPAATANIALHNSNARGWKYHQKKCGEADRLRTERDSARALLKAVYAAGLHTTPCEDCADLRARIAKELGDAS